MLEYEGRKYKTMILDVVLHFQAYEDVDAHDEAISGILLAPESLQEALEDENGNPKEDAESLEVDERIYHFVEDEILETKTPAEIAENYLDEPGTLVNVIENDYE